MSKTPISSGRPFKDFEDYRKFHDQNLPDWAVKFRPNARPGVLPDQYKQRLGYRTEFQRDRDDILYSPSFRHLAYKRQIFGGRDTFSFYTRLTHTLIVSQLARSIGRGLQLDEYLIEAISLGHDLGHAPYGHSGEDGINHFLNANLFPALVQEKGMAQVLNLTIRQRVEETRKISSKPRPTRQDGQYSMFEMTNEALVDDLEKLFYVKPDQKKIFSHNSQSYRLVMYLEKDGRGLELSFFANYGIFSASGKIKNEESINLKGEHLIPDHASFESQVVRLADDIAWVNHDLTEDCKTNNRAPRELLREYFDKEGLGGLINHYEDIDHFLDLGAGERYGKFVTNVIEHNKNKLKPYGYLVQDDGKPGYTICLGPEMKKYLDDMMNIVSNTVHQSPEMVAIAARSQQEIEDICNFVFQPNNFSQVVDPCIYRRKDISQLSILEKLRAVADAVSHLSDKEADDYHKDHMTANRSPKLGTKTLEPLPWGIKLG
jgi:dGTP triphosphohydrolase